MGPNALWPTETKILGRPTLQRPHPHPMRRNARHGGRFLTKISSATNRVTYTLTELSPPHGVGNAVYGTTMYACRFVANRAWACTNQRENLGPSTLRQLSLSGVRLPCCNPDSIDVKNVFLRFLFLSRF